MIKYLLGREIRRGSFDLFLDYRAGRDVLKNTLFSPDVEIEGLGAELPTLAKLAALRKSQVI